MDQTAIMISLGLPSLFTFIMGMFVVGMFIEDLMYGDTSYVNEVLDADIAFELYSVRQHIRALSNELAEIRVARVASLKTTIRLYLESVKAERAERALASAVSELSSMKYRKPKMSRKRPTTLPYHRPVTVPYMTAVRVN